MTKSDCFNQAVATIKATLASLSAGWDGKAAILEMKEAECKNWRQMEWIGWYFQFLCEKYLEGVVTMPGSKYGQAAFDGFLCVPWDYKAHATNTSSNQIIVNDLEAVTLAVKQYGAVGLVLALGDVVYNDESRTFQAWHDQLKGEKSAYVVANIARGAWSRLRKVSFDLKQIVFIKITEATLERCGAFQENFRNSDGSPRRPKLLIDLEEIGDDLIETIDF